MTNTENQMEEFNPKFKKTIESFNQIEEELNTIAENPAVAKRLYILIKKIESLIEKYDLIILNCKITKEVCNSWIEKKINSQPERRMLPSDDLAYMNKLIDYLGDIEQVLLISHFALLTAKNLFKYAYEIKDKHFADEVGVIL